MSLEEILGPEVDAVLDGDELRWAYLAACEAGDDAEADRLGARIDYYAAQEQGDEHLDVPGAIGAAAEFYAAHGIPVFPLRPGGKEPLPGTRGFRDASADPALARARWAARPEPNLGIPTGPRPAGAGWDVVDFDGALGLRSLHQFDGVPLLGRVKTARPGGWHHLIPCAEHSQNRAGLFPGVDVRGAGGYVVAPPSRIGDRRYRWTTVPTALAVDA